MTPPSPAPIDSDEPRPPLAPIDPTQPLPEERRQVWVQLDNVDVYDLNPRLTENAEYATIRDSIETRGLDQPLTITQRPGADKFVLRGGGGTRYRALQELFERTGDRERFGGFEAIYVPWVSELDTLLAHATENVLRAKLNFYEKVQLESTLFALVSREDPTFAKATYRTRATRYAKIGYKITYSHLSTYNYVRRRLDPVLRDALLAGLERREVLAIRSLERHLESVVRERNPEALSDLDVLFGEALAAAASPSFEMPAFRRDAIARVARHLHVSPAELRQTSRREADVSEAASSEAAVGGAVPADLDESPSLSSAPPVADPVVVPGLGTNTPTLAEHQPPFHQPASEDGKAPVDPPAPAEVAVTHAPDEPEDLDPFDVPESGYPFRSEDAEPDVPAAADIDPAALVADALDVARSLADDYRWVGLSFFHDDDAPLGYRMEVPEADALEEMPHRLDALVVHRALYGIGWASAKLAPSSAGEGARAMPSPADMVRSPCYAKVDPSVLLLREEELGLLAALHHADAYYSRDNYYPGDYYYPREADLHDRLVKFRRAAADVLTVSCVPAPTSSCAPLHPPPAHPFAPLD